MSDNIEENNHKINNDTNVTESIDIQKSNFSDESSFNTTINPPLINNNALFPNNLTIKYINELLQELHAFLLNMDSQVEIDNLYNLVKNFLFEYDLDSDNVFEIISNSQYTSCYSSLIGYFYQHGIGCKIDEIRAFEIYSNAVKNNQKTLFDQFSFDQKNESIIFHNDDIKELNGIIAQYFYSIFLYKDVILYIGANYKFHIKNAEIGDNVSQYYIGYYYCYDIFSTKLDYSKAVEWYSKSSEGGNIKAMFELGICYEYGDEDIRDEKKAFNLYLKSAEGGYRRALYELGNCYHYGRCTFKDEDKAFESYLKAAEKGHNFSQYEVANYYNYGRHVPKNEEKGFYWNRKAAINGNTDAQFKLAECYLNNSINKNEEKAFKWYLKLANDGFERAMDSVAKCYRDGIGTNINLEEATKWNKQYDDILFEVDSFLYYDGVNIY
ncbi:uncharacterized protein OCT59_008789 [Rhizophagus irregularis]|uniref:Skt5p n=1 Tax=Rhizophagus irregularis (strain DAOM 197198w) TaxID=1432141 RepID=A0A015JAK2_RHIIW|nr:Skt5p [Rhizophagus irregularis DAOM 197198w]UZO17433.1 hypothetical protein OCT59_008789 [Rhizophagus irregularis]GBC24057.1 kinase-like domain-containing protein [Rhizophagus irregularis DAOM 181602=DAOM 197198]